MNNTNIIVYCSSDKRVQMLEVFFMRQCFKRNEQCGDNAVLSKSTGRVGLLDAGWCWKGLQLRNQTTVICRDSDGKQVGEQMHWGYLAFGYGVFPKVRSVKGETFR